MNHPVRIFLVGVFGELFLPGVSPFDLPTLVRSRLFGFSLSPVCDHKKSTTVVSLLLGWISGAHTGSTDHADTGSKDRFNVMVKVATTATIPPWLLHKSRSPDTPCRVQETRSKSKRHGVSYIAGAAFHMVIWRASYGIWLWWIEHSNRPEVSVRSAFDLVLVFCTIINYYRYTALVSGRNKKRPINTRSGKAEILSYMGHTTARYLYYWQQNKSSGGQY